MNVTMPDGTVIANVPDGTTKAQLIAKLKSNGYDTTGLEPSTRSIKEKYVKTADSDSFLTNLAAGAGGAVTGIGMGLRQLNPFGNGPSDDEVREYQASMEGLRGTTGGMLGEIGTYLVPSVGAAKGMSAIPAVARLLTAGGGKALGAAAGMAATEGAVTGALRPVTEDESRLGNMATEAAFNAVVPVAIAGGGKASSVVREMFAPFLGKEAKNVSAARLIKRASGAKYGQGADDVVAVLQSPTPFSKPSVAQATAGMNKHNIAGLQQVAEREFPDAAMARINAQKLEREGLLRSFAGTDDEIARMIESRAATSAANSARVGEGATTLRIGRESAVMPPPPVVTTVPSQVQPGMVQKVVSAGETPNFPSAPLLESLKQNPGFRAAMADARRRAANAKGIADSGFTPDEIADILKDPTKSFKGLQLMKAAIDDRFANPTNTSTALSKIDDRSLTKLKNAFVGASEQAAPGWGAARGKFAEQSGEIFQKQVGQNMLELLQKPLGEKETGAKLARAIEAETQLVKKAGGFGREGLDEQLTPENLARVKKVVSQLDVDETVRELASVGVGSKAVKDLAGETLSLPNLMNASVALTNGALRRIFGMSKESTMKDLSVMMQDPEMVAKYMQLATQKEKNAIKVITKLMTYAPAVRSATSEAE